MNCPLAGVANVSVWFQSKERQRNGIFGFGRARNETSTKKWKRGQGEGKEASKQAFPSILPHPLPSLLLAQFFARSLALVPRSLFRDRTETLATQVPVVERWSLWRGGRYCNFMMADSSQGNFVLTSLLTSRIWLDVTGFPESSWAPSATITMHKRRPLSLTLHAIHSRDHH